MRYYFIDYENTDVAGFEGVSLLDETDAVYLYYSEKHNRMTIHLHRKIVESKATFLYRKIQETGKDALDHELLKEVEMIIQQNITINLPTQNIYYIISNDKGYEEQIKNWIERGVKVEKCSNIKESMLTFEEKLQLENKKLEAELIQIKKEKEILLQEKKMLQAEIATLKEEKTLRQTQLKKKLKESGMTEKELKTIEPHVNELLNANDRGTRSGLLTKLLPGKKLKNYLDAFENI